MINNIWNWVEMVTKSINSDDYVIICLCFIESGCCIHNVCSSLVLFRLRSISQWNCLSYDNPILLELSCENKLDFTLCPSCIIVWQTFFKMGIFILSAISNIWLLLLLSLGAILPYHFILFYYMCFPSPSFRFNG